jgi:hypothetical protein
MANGAFIIFCLTSLQVAFLTPYIVLCPGENSNLFSGVLCACTLVAATAVGVKEGYRFPRGEVIVSVALTASAALSGMFAINPASSSARSFVVMASGLGGFWAARILLADLERRRRFLQLCLAILGGLLILSLAGHARAGLAYAYLDVNFHPLANRILLLWFAPLTLLITGGAYARCAAVIMLLLSYCVFFVSQLRSAMVIPLGLLAVGACFKGLRLRHAIPLLMLLTVILAVFFSRLPAVKIGKEYEPAYYRVENYLFSWHIAKKHPLLGIGLTSPRDQFLEDYEIAYPYVSKETFADSVRRIRTSENTFLNFMAELGFPFLIVYVFALAVLLRRLIRSAAGPLGEPALFPPLALLLPIAAGLLHFQVLDGLLHPQISWFFHILLGLIPTNGGAMKPPLDPPASKAG